MNFKVHQVDKDTRKDGRVNGKETKIKHGGMVWRRLHRCTRRPHNLATMATHPHHTKERCPTHHLEQKFFDLPQPEQGMKIMGAYARRNMEDIDAIRRHTSQLEDGTAGIAYQMGLLGLAPPEQFDGGAFQQYYDQGYNARGNQAE